ncbi:MAG: cobalamin biosynthesis protein CobD [Deltaproteobacteria bacterium]|nr:cobalamin biosynthesis protein CobD [Deltaproteobacteria bacterium]
MSVFEAMFILLLSFLLDLLLGDPAYHYHPIRMMGRTISQLEEGLRKHGWHGRPAGILLVVLTAVFVLLPYLFLHTLLYHVHPWVAVIFNVFICYSCLALGDLFHHIRPVLRSLEAEDYHEARRCVAMIVGRDVSALDAAALGRAAVETMAENFVDGFLSPVFWFSFGVSLSLFINTTAINAGIIFMLLFKVVSTLDSMVGYKNVKYIRFGWAGAFMDDIMNFIPARLSLPCLFLGALITGPDPVRGFKVAIRDRLKHDSPNAAHAESFMAGALGIRLGGPTRYPDGLKEKPWLGNGNPNPGVKAINRTKNNLLASAWVSVFASLCLFLFIYYVKAS